MHQLDTLEANFPPIADYAFLSDCQTTCLVAPTGAIEWMCLPGPHDPSVFGTILDRAAGSFSLSPADRAVPAHRQYVPGTMVLSTTWQAGNGWLAVNDFLAVGKWYQDGLRSSHYQRTPGDYDARHLIVRSATCLHGTIDVVVNCEPTFDYGREDARWEYSGDGYDSVVTINEGFPRLRLYGDLRFGIDGRAARARRRLVEGESIFVVLGWTDDPAPASRGEVNECLAETYRFWRGWLDGGRFPDHPWRELIQRSALTLKGLTYSPTGALLAAPSTSLPEEVGGSRNWDYRYTWVRDAAFTLRALRMLGFDREADDFLAFLSDALETLEGNSRTRRDLRVLYPIDGGPPMGEKELDHLSGYAGSRPVRVGNGAEGQTQLDILGAIVDCVFEHTRTRDSLSERSWRIVIQAVEDAMRLWKDPDHGIWETRGELQHFTFSKVMCWLALDRGARLARLRGEMARAASWFAAADEIHEDVCEKGVNADGVFTQAYGSQELDASLLALPIIDFLPPDDPRIRATVVAIALGLTEGALVYRYRSATVDDGMGGTPEGSFTTCSFWLVSALVAIGELDLARSHCERLISSASSLGLYAEEIDPITGRHLGNFPQALTHLAMVDA
ncbi:MAG TPA: glycoside hydrolase family 15 protein, partial [Acidimicrobiales bacterium]|nr:glycoside hydrolase family 15 protein [Acidimicrobiales bacterium]